MARQITPFELNEWQQGSRNVLRNSELCLVDQRFDLVGRLVGDGAYAVISEVQSKIGTR